MKEFELELISVLADTLALEDDCPDEFRVIECTIKPSASVEAVQQDRRVFLGLAGWPAADIVMFWSEHQSSVFKAIDVIYHLTAVDTPDLFDFVAAQFPDSYHG